MKNGLVAGPYFGGLTYANANMSKCPCPTQYVFTESSKVSVLEAAALTVN
jgi:hypothetical protein